MTTGLCSQRSSIRWKSRINFTAAARACPTCQQLARLCENVVEAQKPQAMLTVTD